MLSIDHLAIVAETLAAGVAHVEAVLGVPLAPGGEHPHMGTHNRLLSLGPGCYLEVIAINPAATGPNHPRWFNLDQFKGPPRLTHWICRTDDIEAALIAAPEGAGRPLPLSRGDYQWQMAVQPSGQTPFEGGFPSLIQWDSALHPADRLPDAGCRLRGLSITHPDAAALGAALRDMLHDDRLRIAPGSDAAFRAEIETPAGLRVLE